MSDEHMEYLLSSITQFDEMKGKEFVLKKCALCPQIAALQRRLGFAPGEPINAKNIRRIIPATEHIDLILKTKKQNRTPPQKIQPGKVCTPQNRFGIGECFRPGSSRTPNTATGVNSRFSTPVTSKSSIKKVSAQHDIVGAILKRGSSTALASRFYTPNTAKNSTAKITDPLHLDSRIWSSGSTHTTTGVTSHILTPNSKGSSLLKVTFPQHFRGKILNSGSTHGATNGVARPTATTTDVTPDLPTPKAKDRSFVKDKTEFSKNSDGEATSSQESGVSVSFVHTEICEDKENDEIPDLEF